MPRTKPATGRRRRERGAQASLQWAVSFAGEDLHEFSDGDWLNLRDDMGRFFGFGVTTIPEAGDFSTYPMPPPQKASRSEIGRIRAVSRRLLERAVTRIPSEGGILKARDRLRLTATWSVMPFADTGVALVSAVGTLRHLFLIRLLFLLAREGLANVKLCPAPNCGRPFWKVGRKRYCDSTCAFQGWLTNSEKGRARPERERKAAQERRKYKRQREKQKKGGKR